MVLDRILKKFLKFLSFKCDGTYPERGTDMSLLLQRHQMSSLSSRRDFYCARFLAKLVSNEIDCIDLLSNISFNVPRLSSRFVQTFKIPRARTNVLRRAPIYTMSCCGNNCLEDIFC